MTCVLETSLNIHFSIFHGWFEVFQFYLTFQYAHLPSLSSWSWIHHVPHSTNQLKLPFCAVRLVWRYWHFSLEKIYCLMDWLRSEFTWTLFYLGHFIHSCRYFYPQLIHTGSCALTSTFCSQSLQIIFWASILSLPESHAEITVSLISGALRLCDLWRIWGQEDCLFLSSGHLELSKELFRCLFWSFK